MKPYDICKLGIGRTFQIPQSLNDMMVYENVLVGALCKRHNIEEAMKPDRIIVKYFPQIFNPENS